MADKTIFGFSGPTNPDLKRAYHDKSYVNNMTARLGRAYPFLVEDAAPATTYKIKLTSAFDMMPMVFPVQSTIRQHFGVWKIPYRILWKNFKDFTSQVGNHTVPYIARSNNWCATGSLADYMNIATDEVITNNRISSVACHPRFAGAISPLAILGHVSSRADGSQYYDISGGANGLSQLFDTGAGYTSSVIGFGFLTESIPYHLNDGIFYLSRLSFQVFNGPSASGAKLNIKALVRSGSMNETNRWHVYDIESLTFQHSVSATAYPHSGLGETVMERDADSTNIGRPGSYTTKIVGRLSQSAITLLNSLIDTSEVRLLINWDNNDSPSSYLFGDLSYLMANFDSSNNILTRSTSEIEEGSGKTLTLPQYDGYQGLLLSFSYNCSVIDTADPSNNPFIIQSGQSVPACPINAFSFRAYEFLYNFVFRQERVTPFIKGGEEVYNEFLTNDGDGADATTPVDFFNVPYEFDMFTTCVKTPQFGNAPLVGVSYNNQNASGTLHMVPESGDPYNIGVDLDGNANVIGISNYSEVADKPSVARLQEAISFGISINDFRNVSAFQRFCERFMKAGYRYEDLMYEFFGTNPPTGEEFPEFVGGMTRMVDISKISNVAETPDAYLGKFAGTGFVAGKSKTIKFRCSEPCIVMGLTWFTVTPVYSQFLPKMHVKHEYFDWFNPQFNSIGPQPVYKYQLNPFAETNWSSPQVFGYNRPWLDYVTRVDEVHGEFRRTMKNYLIQRYFAGLPELGQDFLYIDPAQLTDVFAVQDDTDKFWGQIRVDMQVKTPVARFAIPHIVG